MGIQNKVIELKSIELASIEYERDINDITSTFDIYQKSKVV